MKKAQLQTLVNSLIPKFYSFAFALVPDELQAEQMVIDAYAVFVVREKNFIAKFKYSDDKKEKSIFKKYIMSHMINEIFKMGVKRSSQLRILGNRNHGQYESFYNLKTNQRAILFLKESFKYNVETIQDILGLEKYQVIETLYNGRQSILAVNELPENNSRGFKSV